MQLRFRKLTARTITLKHSGCCRPCIGEGKQLIGEMEGSMIPVVRIDKNCTGDKRKARQLEWQEARLVWYMSNRPGQFDDCSAKAADPPMGSGTVESANRSVVQNRLKILGAWWKEDNASAMLALRRTRVDGEWEQYWKQSGDCKAHFSLHPVLGVFNGLLPDIRNQTYFN